MSEHVSRYSVNYRDAQVAEKHWVMIPLELPLFKEVVERPNLEIMVAQAEEKRVLSPAVHILIFKSEPVGIAADYMNNPAELAKIHSSIDSIREDDNYRIARIKIVGYSSPEGNYDANARLSEQRAKAVVQNLKHAYKVDDSMIECRSVPENWEGLAAWLCEYRPSYMQKVLDIIGQTPRTGCARCEDKKLSMAEKYIMPFARGISKLRLVEYTVQLYSGSVLCRAGTTGNHQNTSR